MNPLALCSAMSEMLEFPGNRVGMCFLAGICWAAPFLNELSGVTLYISIKVVLWNADLLVGSTKSRTNCDSGGGIGTALSRVGNDIYF